MLKKLTAFFRARKERRLECLAAARELAWREAWYERRAPSFRHSDMPYPDGLPYNCEGRLRNEMDKRTTAELALLTPEQVEAWADEEIEKVHQEARRRYLRSREAW